MLSLCTVLGDTMAKRGGRSSKRSVRALSSLDPDLLRLSPIADLRVWHPEKFDRPITDVLGRIAPIVISSPRRPFKVGVGVKSRSLRNVRRSSLGFGPLSGSVVSGRLPSSVMLKVPKRVALCVRRKSRREVIFAKKKAGAGARSRRRHRDWRSNIHC